MPTLWLDELCWASGRYKCTRQFWTRTTIYISSSIFQSQMRPTISLLNFRIYWMWMTVMYPGRVISGFTFGVRYKYYSCSKAYKVMKVHRQVYQAFIWEDRMYEDCKHQHVDFKPIILIYTFTRLCSLQAYISWFHNGFFFFVAHLFCLVSFQKKNLFCLEHSHHVKEEETYLMPP